MSIITIPEAFNVGSIKIFAIIPVFRDNTIVFISREFKDAQLEIKFDNLWKPMTLYKRKDSKYGNEVIYMCNVDKKVMDLIKTKGSMNIELFSKLDRRKTKAIIRDHGLRPLDLDKQYIFIESLTHIFFEGSIEKKQHYVKLALAWIEYHLQKGVDQIFINQSKYFDKSNNISTEFWKKLLSPYLKSGKVILVLYDDKMNRYSHQSIIQNVCLWLNKGRTKWFGTHDLDEYICPPTGYWDPGTDIRTVLSKVPDDVNYIETKMVRADIPEFPQIYTTPTKICTGYMWCWHKCIVTTDSVNILWVHTPSHWNKKKKSTDQIMLRINHYKSKTIGFHNSNPPDMDYDGLHAEHLQLLENISSLYGESLDQVAITMTKNIPI